MFESLKKKLSAFRKKAAEQLPVTKEPIEERLEQPQEDIVARAIGDSGRKIDESRLEELLWDLEVSLLEADVALEVVEEIRERTKREFLQRRIDRKYKLEEVVTAALRNAIEGVLVESEFDLDAFVASTEKPAIIMFVGINGTGKTTAIAKVAKRLIDSGYSVVLSASDTFRAGAVEQLSFHGEQLGSKVIKHQAGGDPAAVAYDAIEHAKARRKDVVLIDTAGRMQTNKNLMDEMKKIKRVAKPDLVVFVGDALAGNDAIEQARAFDREVGIDAVILTKIDADARGGAALSIAHAINKPIAFLSTGQEYDQLVKFSAGWMIERLFS